MKSVSRYALSWLIGVLVFVFVCAGISKLFPQQVSGISLKVHRFTEEKDHVDVIFVGSSRIYHGIEPKVFDQTLVASGHQWRSFNVAMDGMTTAEGFAMVRRLVALHPKKLKYIFFEAQSAIAAGTPIGDQKVTERDVYWRDWDSLRSSFRTFAMGLTWPNGTLPGVPYSFRRLDDFGPLLASNVRLWIRNVTNVGVGTEIFQNAAAALPPFKNPPPKPEGADIPANWDGYYAMSKPMSGETLATYRNAFADAHDHPVQRTPRRMMRGELRTFAQEMAAKKIQIVFVVPPSLMAGRGSGIHVPSGSRLFAYDDLDRYPQFYAEENRLDVEHLNGRGAELFSQTMAQEFVHSLDSPVR